MSDKTKQIEILIDRLRGSATSMQTECDDLDLSTMDDEVTRAVDDEIFNCTDCNWWCDISEECSEECDADEWVCQDCGRDNHGWEGE